MSPTCEPTGQAVVPIVGALVATGVDEALEAAKELGKILADELGITDALDCVTKGDMGACTET